MKGRCGFEAPRQYSSKLYTLSYWVGADELAQASGQVVHSNNGEERGEELGGIARRRIRVEAYTCGDVVDPKLGHGS